MDADIDVGGYAWSREGYDFADRHDIAELMTKLQDNIGSYLDRADEARDPKLRESLTVQAQAASDLVQRVRGGAEVTPFELGEVGRQPGMSGRNATWIGKDTMLGSEWLGVKRL